MISSLKTMGQVNKHSNSFTQQHRSKRTSTRISFQPFWNAVCGPIKGTVQLTGYSAVEELYTESFLREKLEELGVGGGGGEGIPMYVEIFSASSPLALLCWCGV
jgi:hypothetical protein